MSDTQDWLTLPEAAEAIGISTRTVRQKAKEKLIQTKPGKGIGSHRCTLYHPGDVARMRAERNPEAPPFVMPEKDSGNSGSTALVRHQPGTELSHLRDMFSALLGMPAGSVPAPLAPSELRHRLYLTAAEAAR